MESSNTKATLVSDKKKVIEEYWLKKLKGEFQPILLYSNKLSIENNSEGLLSFELPDKTVSELKNICNTSDLGLFLLSLVCFQVCLKKYTNIDDLIIGTTTLKENPSNILFLRNKIDKAILLKDHLSNIQQPTLETFNYFQYSIQDILKKLELKEGNDKNIFNVAFLYDAIQNDNEQLTKFDLVFKLNKKGQAYYINVNYNKEQYSIDTVNRVVESYLFVLSNVKTNLKLDLSNIQILSDEEKYKVLKEFNNTKVIYPKDKTIHQLFEEQVEQRPDNLALECENKTYTYQELNEESNQIAHYLIEKGLKREDIIGIVLDSSYQYVVCMFAVLKSGGAFLPIDKKLPDLRKEYIVENSELKMLIHDDVYYEKNAPDNIESINIKKLDVENFQLTNPSVEINSSNLAYIIYTSGSTGKPKGTLLEHKGIVSENIFWKESLKINSTDRCLQFSNISFDASVWEIYLCLFNGASLFIPDENIKIDTGLFEEYLVENQITVATLPPTFADNLNESVFKNFRLVITAGSETNSKLIEKISKNTWYLNAYGPTETSVCATYWDTSEFSKIGKIVIGRSIQNIEAYIINSHLQLQGIGISGELCFSGDGLARGYLKNPELTREKFIPHPFKEGERLYRTGDLARWLPDGNIEFLGRIDNQVKIRGFRIELGEIENTLLKHESIKESVVLDREENADKYLCAYVVTNKDFNQEEVRTYLSASLPDYMIPSYFVEIDNIPLTTNGKVNRKALPFPEIKSGDDYVGPSNEVESQLTDIWSELLKMPKEEISVNTNFFSIGGHSLKATIILSKIHKEFNAKIPLTTFFKDPYIVGLAEQIKTLDKSYFNIEKTIDKDYYTATSSQKRLYIINQIDKNSTVYNINSVLEIEGVLDKDKIEKAFKRLINRQACLRTSFEMKDDTLFQKINNEVDIIIEYFKLEDQSIEEAIKYTLRSFDLNKVPLFRIGIIEKAPNKSILVFCIHHIISDGFSLKILIDEFVSLYSEIDLKPLQLQYKDYSEWLLKNEQLQTRNSQENFWLNLYKEEAPVINLPADYYRPVSQSHAGNRYDFEIDQKKTTELNNLSIETGTTMYTVLLSAYYILLSKLSNQEDIVIGSPVSGRNYAGLETIIGMFVNTLPIRNYPKGEYHFNEFIEEVNKITLDAFDNQEYPYEELVEKVVKTRDVSRNPLFDVMFSLQNMETGDLIMPKIKISPYEISQKTSQFDLTLVCHEKEGKTQCSFIYCTDLFKETTIKKFAKYFKKVVDIVSTNNKVKISDISLLAEDEKNKLLYEFNNTKSPYPQDKTIIDFFEEQVECIPQATAVNIAGNEISYSELNTKANQLCKLLREKGVESNNIVAIEAERSIEMIIGIYGILKAGGAYLPIDPNYPEERKKYIITNSKCDILLTQAKFSERINGEFIKIELEDENIYKKPTDQLNKINSPSDLAYVIYTSGSTGEPKGVMIEHGSLVNRLNWMQRKYPINANDTLLQKTPYTFDVSVWELFWWAMTGSKLSMLKPGEEKEPDSIIKTIEEQKITVLHFVPSMLNVFLDYLMNEESQLNNLTSITQVITSGEALLPMHVEKFNNTLGKNPKSKLANLYGPTEATIDVTYYDCLEQNPIDLVPIGKPIDNTQLYIIDKNNQIQPLGVPGELCIGGVGLARGYWQNKELTESKFISNPFKEGERIYRTGDLVKWLPDGNIEYLGRLDYQVKIRGNRIELKEIEISLTKHEKIKEALVTALGEEGEKYLCAYLVSEEELEISDLRAYLSKSLPEYMLPSYFISLETMPLTSNGKIDRKALPKPEIKAGAGYIAPQTLLETKLVKIWSDLLNIPFKEISTSVSFFDMGGNSLKATLLISWIHKELEIRLELRDIFNYQTIQRQSELIYSSESTSYFSIPKAKKQTCYLLSSSQRRLYLLQQMNLRSIAYNMPGLIVVPKCLNKDQIKDIFNKLILRHENFRTSFEIKDKLPIQRIHSKVSFSIKEYQIKREELPIIREEFRQAFDLSVAPLLRVSYLEILNGDDVLLVDMHHIISDGMSHLILEKEFYQLIAGEELKPLRLQYKDYSEWQNSTEQQLRIKDQESYWLDKFKDNLSVLELPMDYSRPVMKSFEGASVDFLLSKEETKVINEICKSQGLTQYMCLMSVFAILLSKLSGQEDVIIGSPVAARRHADLDGVVGMFVNTLTIRSEVSGEAQIIDYLQEFKENILEAYENQEYQFEDLVDKVVLNRDTSRNPIFDVMFNLLNQKDFTEDLLVLKNIENTHKTNLSKFDLTLTAVDYGEQLFLNFTYCTKLFIAETIDRYISYFKRIVNQLPEKLEKHIFEIEIISEEEKHQLLYEFNDTEFDYPRDKTIHQLFEEQARRTPDNLAVVSGEGQISHSELNKKSNQLAQYLRNKGLGSNSVVSLFFDPSLEMLISFIGVLKSGAAYLPINTELPKDRVCYMILDSGSDIVLTQGQISFESLSEIEIVDVGNIIIREDYDELKDSNNKFDSAYIIYTSGTTGKPKGVLLSHKNLMNYFRWFNETSKIGSDDRTVLVTSYAFDLGYTGLYSSIINGSQLHLIPKDLYLSSNTFIDYIIRNRISYLKLTSSLYTLLVDNDKFEKAVKNLRLLVLGGEEINVEAVVTSLSLNNKLQVINHYGPTEATIGCISFGINKSNINEYKNRSVIGEPINNTKVYVLNEYDQIQPTSVPGELCISGDGLAIGYLNSPELTAEKFIDHPFKEGERLYRTGDLARWLPDGNIEFLGRIDHQVKIRGFRIELNEIENVLLKHDSIDECLVIVREENQDKFLCAYIVSKAEFNHTMLRVYLSKFLPDYMIPEIFIKLEKIPLTRNGKIDKKLLQERYIPKQSDENYVEPTEQMEIEVANVWKSVLNVDKVGLHSNFFDLGGNSLKIINLSVEMEKLLGKEVPVNKMFEYSTIASLLEYLNNSDEDEDLKKAELEQIDSTVETSQEIMRSKLALFDKINRS